MNGSCIFLGDQIGPNWDQNCEESWRLRQGSVSCNSCQSKSDFGRYLACHRLIAAPIMLPPMCCCRFCCWWWWCSSLGLRSKPGWSIDRSDCHGLKQSGYSSTNYLYHLQTIWKSNFVLHSCCVCDLSPHYLLPSLSLSLRVMSVWSSTWHDYCCWSSVICCTSC